MTEPPPMTLEAWPLVGCSTTGKDPPEAQGCPQGFATTSHGGFLSVPGTTLSESWDSAALKGDSVNDGGESRSPRPDVYQPSGSDCRPHEHLALK
jgi:hypothetical protein